MWWNTANPNEARHEPRIAEVSRLVARGDEKVEGAFTAYLMAFTLAHGDDSRELLQKMALLAPLLDEARLQKILSIHGPVDDAARVKALTDAMTTVTGAKRARCE